MSGCKEAALIQCGQLDGTQGKAKKKKQRSKRREHFARKTSINERINQPPPVSYLLEDISRAF